VGFDDRRPAFWLHHPKWSRFKRIAGAKSERLSGIVEGWKCNDSANRARFLDRQKRADFRSERCVAADHLGLCTKRGEVLGKALLEERAIAIREGPDESFSCIERRTAERLLRQRFHL